LSPKPGRLDPYENLPTGVLVLAPDGVVGYANPRAAVLLGMEPAQIVGRAIQSAPFRLTWEDTTEIEGPELPVLAAARSGEAIQDLTVGVRRADGSQRWVRLDVLPVAAAGEAVRQVVVSMIDITARREAELALRDEARLAAARSELLAGVAEARFDVDRLAAAVAGTLARLTGQGCLVTLLDGDAGTLRAAAFEHGDPMLASVFRSQRPALQMRIGQSWSGRVAETGQPLVLRNVPQAEAFSGVAGSTSRQVVEQATLKVLGDQVAELDVVVVPIRGHGRTLGTLGVYTPAGHQRSLVDRLAWLQGVADHAGLAIAGAHLYQEAMRRLERLRADRSVDLALISSLDLGLTLSVILSQATTQLGVDAAAVLLLNDRGELHHAADRGFRGTAIRNTTLAVGEGYAGQAAAGQKTVHVADVRNQDVLSRRRLAVEEGVVTYFGVPLVARGQLKGVLEVFSRTRLDPDPEWLDFLESLAARAALAIDNSVMFEQLQRVRREIARPAETAVQPKLTPSQLTVLRLLAQGYSNQDIAARAHLSENTVKSHLREIFQRLDAGNRLEAVIKAVRLGVLESGES